MGRGAAPDRDQGREWLRLAVAQGTRRQRRRADRDTPTRLFDRGRKRRARRFAVRCAGGRGSNLANAAAFEAASTIYTEALSLWRGHTLAGIELESLDRHEAERLDERRVVTLMDRIDCDLALGRHDDLVGELEVLVAQHPLRERLHAQRILALYRSGRQAEALRAYQQARTLLVEELGLEPSPALQRLNRHPQPRRLITKPRNRTETAP